MKCGICELIKEDKETILKTKFWRVALAEDQTYLGRSYISLLRHAKTISDLTKKELLDFQELSRDLESSLKRSFDATMFNYSCLMNNAYQRNPPNPHIHWHFRPRYKNIVEFAGLTFEDKEFGKHYVNDKKYIISEEIRGQIVTIIRENL